MKKTLSLAEQVKAARAEVESWPVSVKSATELRRSDLFHSTQDEATDSTTNSDHVHRVDATADA